VPGVSARARPVSRRTAVGGVVAAALAGPVLVTGCTLDPPAADPSDGAPAEPEPDADVLLLATVLAAIDGAAALLAATAERHPRLAAGLQPLVDVHAVHRSVLDGAAEVDPDVPPTPTVPGRPPVALARVRRAETRLVGTLREATGAAQSGDLARVLASMAASLTQHLTVTGTEGPAA
jgi:hypothetical protein